MEYTFSWLLGDSGRLENYPKVLFTSLPLKVVTEYRLAPKLRLKNSIPKLRRKENSS